MKCFELVTSCASLMVTDNRPEGAMETSADAAAAAAAAEGAVWLEQPQSGQRSKVKCGRRLTLPDLFASHYSTTTTRCSSLHSASSCDSRSVDAAGGSTLSLPLAANFSCHSASEESPMENATSPSRRSRSRSRSSVDWTSKSAPNSPHSSGFSAAAMKWAREGSSKRQSRSSYALNNCCTQSSVQSVEDVVDVVSMSSSSSFLEGGALAPFVPCGPRFKLVTEGDIQLCRLTHSGTVISKILSSKFLRRWETHRVYLNDAWLSSKTPTGFMEDSVPYSSMKEVTVVVGWDGGHRHCIRIVVPQGSLLLQANNAYVRDQWYHSIIWKKNLFRYQQTTRQTTRQDVLLKEVKSMVDLATSTPLQDHCIAQAPFQVISSLLSMQNERQWTLPHTVLEDLLVTLSPLLERQQPSLEMCTAFSGHCRSHPRSSLVRGLFTVIVQRILKHNVVSRKPARFPAASAPSSPRRHPPSSALFTVPFHSSFRAISEQF